METLFDPVSGIIALLIIGALLVSAEVFVPGMVLGILGGLCLLAGIILSYAEFGLMTGTLVLVGVSFFGLVGFFTWMSSFQKTFVGRQLINRDSLVPPSNSDREGLLGRTGVAISPLRPAGTAKIGDKRVDVVAENHFIEAGSSISVITVEGNRIVVRKIP